MKTRGLAASTRKAPVGKPVARCKEVSTQTMLNMDELDRIMMLFLCPRTEACTQTEGTCLESLPVFDITLDSTGDHRRVYNDSCLITEMGDNSQDCDSSDGGCAVSGKRKQDTVVFQASADCMSEKESPSSGKSPVLTPRTSKRLALKRKLSHSNTKIKCGKKLSDVGKQKSSACKTNRLAIDDGVCKSTESKVDQSSGKKGATLSIVKSEPDEHTSEQTKVLNLSDSEDKNCHGSDKTDCDSKYTKQQNTLPIESNKRLHICKFCSRTFRDVTDFMRHNRMHTKEKPYPCEQCDSSFRWKASYLAHLRQVHQVSSRETSPAGRDENSTGLLNKSSTDGSSVQDFVRSRRKRQKRICKCEFCGKVLRCLANLNRHMLTHTGTRPFPCNQCPRAFSERSGLKNHILRRHSEKQHVCDLCGKHFGSIVFLKQHLKVHTKQREEYICKLCEKVYTTTLALDIHMLAHSGLKPFVCDHCGKKLYSKYQLNRHVKRHYGDQHPSSKKPIKPKSHICNMCSKAFVSSSRLTRHMSTVHSTIHDQQCPTCNKMFSSVGAMKKHTREHNEGPYQCEVCERWWLTKETYNTHMRLHFGRTSSKVFVCVFCNMGFFQMLEVDDHYKSHAENTTFRCMHCEKSFDKREDLVTHRSVHPNQKVPLNCDRCDKLFATLQELRAHEHCHDKPLECVVCDLKFTTEEEAKDHMLSHNDDGSILSTTVLMYKCPKCGKVFTNKDDYNSHALVHEGAEFVCTICDIAFETATLLDGHLSTHTVVKVEAPEVLTSTTELSDQFDSSTSGSGAHVQVLGEVQLQAPVSLVTSATAAETLQTVIQYETVSEDDVSVCNINDVHEVISCTVCGKKFSLIENFLNHCQDHPEIEVTVKTL